MRVLFLGILVCLLLFASSCVPHKEIVYYQDKGTSLDTTATLKERPKLYRVQINDILSIKVKALEQDKVDIINPLGDGDLATSLGERAYYEGFIVDVHGDIRVPTLGNIEVLGLSTTEIEELLEKRLLEEHFKETANIFVTVRLAGLRYTTSGEITNTGTQTLFQEQVNIMEAIANAGGITEFGNATDVMIIRQRPVGQEIVHVDITDVNIINSPYYYIQPNDMLYIKPRKIKTFGFGTTGLQAFTTIAAVLGVFSSVILLTTRF